MDSSSSEDINAAEGLFLLSRAGRKLDTNDNRSVKSSDSTILMDDDDRMDIENDIERQSSAPNSSKQRPPNCNASRNNAHPNNIDSAVSCQPTPLPQSEHRVPEIDPERNLQAYLIRQQLMVGIPPEDIIPMRGQRRGQPAITRTNQPTLLRITENGIVAPDIPPARFTGVIPPLPMNAILARPPAPTNRVTPDPASVVQTRCIDRMLPRIPRSNPAEPAIPLDRLGGQPTWAHEIPRIADFTPAPRPEAGTLLPSVNELLGGATPGPVARDPFIQGADNHSGDDLTSPPPAVDGAFETISTLSSRNNRTGLEIEVRKHAAKKPFNILQSVIENPELTMMLTDHLEPHDITNLMVAAKPFNTFMATHEGVLIAQKANKEAPESAQTFPAACYPSLCKAANHPVADPNVPLSPSPSLRWLSMILYRENAVNKIMDLMDAAGQPLPTPCRYAIKKFWFLMDIPDNKRREWTIQNENMWQDIDIFYAIYFIVRIDLLMRTKFKNRTGGLRRLIMAQPSLSFLVDVLNGKALHTHLDTLRSFVRWQYKPESHEREWSAFGVPSGQVGLLQYEGYGRDGERAVRFTRPDECILMEVDRRQMDLERMYVDIFLYQEVEKYCIGSLENRTWVEEVRIAARGAKPADWLKAGQVSLE
ncbi:hypothetical protein FE257_010320 [Aspergillus nanangensis]|uniref:Uncharacterized protein n=1 Tax=Aspergillus nanangensis TaxID=2582783 RepID=A0AAD4CIU9_ASPNN|nr:hypothetical protein FE257_010320 [Aspergillus nanangensis]